MKCVVNSQLFCPRKLCGAVRKYDWLCFRYHCYSSGYKNAQHNSFESICFGFSLFFLPPPTNTSTRYINFNMDKSCVKSLLQTATPKIGSIKKRYRRASSFGEKASSKFCNHLLYKLLYCLNFNFFMFLIDHPQFHLPSPAHRTWMGGASHPN